MFRFGRRTRLSVVTSARNNRRRPTNAEFRRVVSSRTTGRCFNGTTVAVYRADGRLVGRYSAPGGLARNDGNRTVLIIASKGPGWSSNAMPGLKPPYDVDEPTEIDLCDFVLRYRHFRVAISEFFPSRTRPYAHWRVTTSALVA